VDFLKRADDIEIVDAPAQASLSRLREMALVVAAEVVEAELRALPANASSRRDLGNAGTDSRRHHTAVGCAPILESGSVRGPFSWRTLCRLRPPA
jgi:hypothetical protein